MTSDERDDPPHDGEAPEATLPRPVQEHLARQLRAAYVETQDKPAFLGDPALPPAFDEHLYALRASETARERERASTSGLSAVSTALESLDEPDARPEESDPARERPGAGERSTRMYKGFGVTVTVTQDGSAGETTAAFVVVARDERDAEAVAEKAAGPNAMAETLRELSDDEVHEHDLDLDAHGTAKVLPILNL
jgi:hypothetical protein